METVTLFIEEKLNLKVNQEKSGVDRSWERKLLGLTFCWKDSEVEIRAHEKSKAHLRENVRKITRRNSFDMILHIII
jgi:RNA-directed DNA polymerase